MMRISEPALKATDCYSFHLDDKHLVSFFFFTKKDIFCRSDTGKRSAVVLMQVRELMKEPLHPPVLK